MSSPLLPPEAIVRQAEHPIGAPLDDSLVLMSMKRSAYYNLNPAAAEIWSRLAEPVRVDALCAALEAQFNAPEGVIARDVSTALKVLAEQELITVTLPAAK